MATFEEYDQYDGLGLAKLVQSGVVDPLALLEEAIARTEELNPHVNGLIHALYDEAREAIRIGLPQGPFHGVPFLLKDLHTPMKDTPCQNGSAMWRNSRSASDNTLVKRYRDAGLVIYGKTNTPEMGLNPVTEAKGVRPQPESLEPEQDPRRLQWRRCCSWSLQAHYPLPMPRMAAAPFGSPRPAADCLDSSQVAGGYRRAQSSQRPGPANPPVTS